MFNRKRRLVFLVLSLVMALLLAVPTLAKQMCGKHPHTPAFNGTCAACEREFLATSAGQRLPGESEEAWRARFTAIYQKLWEDEASVIAKKLANGFALEVTADGRINGIKVIFDNIDSMAYYAFSGHTDKCIDFRDLLNIAGAENVMKQVSGLKAKNFKLINGELYCNGVLMENGREYTFGDQVFTFQNDDFSALLGKDFNLKGFGIDPLKLTINDITGLLAYDDIPADENIGEKEVPDEDIESPAPIITPSAG